MAKKDKVYWPSWRYGPAGEAKIFDCAEDVPIGWTETPGAAAPASDSSEEQEETISGFTRSTLEQLLRRSGGRIYARDTIASIYKRCENAGCFDDIDSDDEEDYDSDAE